MGPYRVLRLLGEGGMGVVYLVEREDVGGRAALKLLRDAWVSPSRRARFLAEQRTLAQLDHPGIAQLHDAGTLPDGTPWFAMEYVEGVPLTEYCRAHGSGLGERLRLFRAVCEAVQHAHRHAVIHRDLKPSNILVKADGAVKLLDFGIAKQLEPTGPATDPTRTGLRLMTPAYAAPEQVEGGRLGVETDVYALGVLLFELLSGRLPFELAGLSPHEAARRVLEQEPPRPSQIADRPVQASRAAWADLDVLCLTAMQRVPSRRYPSVEALIRDLDHHLAGEPLDARPDSLAYRVGKLLRRNARAVMVASAVDGGRPRGDRLLRLPAGARARRGGGGGGPDATHPAVHAPALRGWNGRGRARGRAPGGGPPGPRRARGAVARDGARGGGRAAPDPRRHRPEPGPAGPGRRAPGARPEAPSRRLRRGPSGRRPVAGGQRAAGERPGPVRRRRAAGLRRAGDAPPPSPEGRSRGGTGASRRWGRSTRTRESTPLRSASWRRRSACSRGGPTRSPTCRRASPSWRTATSTWASTRRPMR